MNATSPETDLLVFDLKVEKMLKNASLGQTSVILSSLTTSDPSGTRKTVQLPEGVTLDYTIQFPSAAGDGSPSSPASPSNKGPPPDTAIGAELDALDPREVGEDAVLAFG
eukprot:236158_1